MTDPRAAVELPLVEARISVPDVASARTIADTLIARKLAACVQVLGPMLSFYTWEDEVHSNEEWLLLAKTTEKAFPGLAEAVVHLHRYDVPEIIAVPVSHALSSYADWVRTGAAPDSPGDGDEDGAEGRRLHGIPG